MRQVVLRRQPEWRRARFATGNAVCACLCAAACLLPSGPLAWVAGAALVLALPGDAIRRATRSRGIEGLVIVLAASLATTVAAGFIADRLVGGVRTASMATLLACAAIIVDAVVVAGSFGLAPAAASPHGSGTDIRGLLRTYGVAALMFVALSALAVAIATRSELQQGTPAQTALSITPLTGDRAAVELQSQEPGVQTFDLVITANDQQLRRTSVQLRQGQQTTVIVPVPFGTQISAAITKPGQAAPMRSAWLSYNPRFGDDTGH